MEISKAFEALERLKLGLPERILPPYKINNDTVAAEAGYVRGTIKKHNPKHTLLIEEIKKHRDGASKKAAHEKIALKRAKEKNENLKKQLLNSLAREAMYINRIFELETQLRLTGSVQTLIPRLGK